MTDRRLVVAVTGASGSLYALRLLRHLDAAGVGIDLLLSAAGAEVLRREVDDRDWLEEGRPRLESFELDGERHRAFSARDFGAPCASGTGLVGGMVIVPASMGTLGRLAAGTSDNLIGRAADVCLKERRTLLLVCRETPLSTIHLRNMLTLAEAGAVILPAAPGFYRRPRSINDLADHLCAKILDNLGLVHNILKPWGED